MFIDKERVVIEVVKNILIANADNSRREGDTDSAIASQKCIDILNGADRPEPNILTIPDKVEQTVEEKEKEQADSYKYQ